MKFSEKIVRLRKIRGLTQDELASAVGVSRQAVYKWECGQSYPEVMKLVEIKALFGISIDDLLDESYEIALPDKKKRKRIKRERASIIEREVEAEINAIPVEENSEEEEITVVEVNATPAIEENEDLIRECVTMPTVEESTEDIIEVAEEQTSVASWETVEEVAPEASEVSEDESEAVSPEVTDVDSDDEPKEEKKRGFFSRLFGRR